MIIIIIAVACVIISYVFHISTVHDFPKTFFPKSIVSWNSGEVRGEMSFQNTPGLEDSSQKMHQKSSEDV